MLKIEITYDGGEVVVKHSDINRELLAELVNKLETVADEPCPQGHKCEVIKSILASLREINGG